MSKFLIGYRDDDGKIGYYIGMNGRSGKAIIGPKCEAPRFDENMAEKICSQLPTLDNRGWVYVPDKKRCQFE